MPYQDPVALVESISESTSAQLPVPSLLTEVIERTPPLAFKIVVVNDDGEAQPSIALPDRLPDWAMSISDHRSTLQRTATYRCTDSECGGEHEEYRQNPRSLPYAKVCGCIRTAEDGSAATCSAAALRRTTYPGEGVALNARRFEPLVIFERADFESRSDDYKRSHQRFYVPGRNYEPTEPGMKRIEITNIQEYNQTIKRINQYETDKMRDHRSMHEEYWKARRKALRDHYDARMGPLRSNPLIAQLRYLMRKRSDQKSAVRYGKPLDAHFHAQLIEFDQGHIQDWCDADTGWKARRAK